MFPSQIAQRGYLHIHYQQVIDLGSAERFSHSAYSLKTDANIPRNTRRLPPLSGRQIALARGCCSIVLKSYKKLWLAMILIDPPVKDVFEILQSGCRKVYSSKPLHGGFEGFAPAAPFSSFSHSQDDHLSFWDKSSLLASLLRYFQTQPPGFTLIKPSILSLGYYPMRIILAEWIIYVHLVSRYLKHYEYSLHDINSRVHDSDIVDLQRWRRRGKQSQHKLSLLSEFISYWLPAETDKQQWDVLLKDISYVSSQLKDYNQSLEQVVPLTTSVVQLLESRRSMIQAVNVTRLTYIALVFVPLSWATGLFSMSERYAPGQEYFWVYCVTALPLLLLVLLVSVLSPGRLTQGMSGCLKLFSKTASRNTTSYNDPEKHSTG